MNKLTLKAEKRKILGRKVKRLRKDGILPANLFGKKIKSESIQVKDWEFEKIYKEAGETGLVELQLNSDKKPVLIHHVQLDPVSEKIIHADFLQVNLKEKVTAAIPIELVGESLIEKQGLGTVVQYMDEVEVEALPTDLPEKFEVDMEIFSEVDKTLILKDLKVDKSKIEIREDLEKIVAKAEAVKEEVQEPVVSETTEAQPVQEGETSQIDQPEDKENKTS